jgi:predicted RNA-binding protein YlxR (DUF448 family)
MARLCAAPFATCAISQTDASPRPFALHPTSLALSLASALSSRMTSFRRSTMGKQRHIPIRTCVACRTADIKRVLLRVVRQADGSVRYDPKGKLSGRGAYVCARQECIALARKQKKLERSLKVNGLPEELYIELGTRAAEVAQEERPGEASGTAAVTQPVSPRHPLAKTGRTAPSEALSGVPRTAFSVPDLKETPGELGGGMEPQESEGKKV